MIIVESIKNQVDIDLNINNIEIEKVHIETLSYFLTPFFILEEHREVE
ncbi:hypothetical protein [Evansella cellulosilytica]|uniref:Uncharacterized protein n=1 Tax=Evansella cellulosilytica (strain ATCC 21833 / DSM 2522 / FERM P-1141 / JCM 9156 / N-4) TaxID=649639 RepID=E6U1K6_EVAC2|nr:hypothetical protein [Evansella cellulosilytica]ADU30369.1 hypothetical protein Bcell_2108 [Evansella cellulosilytica DSM 2522]